MNTAFNHAEQGRVFYDAECRFCRTARQHLGGPFERRGFRWWPMQTPQTAAQLGLTEEQLYASLWLLLPGGRVLGGIEAWSRLMRAVWWLWPLGRLLVLPGIYAVAGRVYGWIARNRYCFQGTCVAPPVQAQRAAAKRRTRRVFFDAP